MFIHPRNVSELVWEPHSLPGLCWQLQAAFTTQPRLQSAEPSSAEPSSAALSCTQRGWGLSPPTFPPFLLPEMLCRICWGSPGCFLLVLLHFCGSPQVQLNSPEGQVDKQLGFCVHIPFWWLSAAEGPLRARKGPAAPPQLSLRCFKLGRNILLVVSVRKGHPWDPWGFSLCPSASWKRAGKKGGTAGLLEPWLSVQLWHRHPLPWCKSWNWGSALAEHRECRVTSSSPSPPAFCALHICNSCSPPQALLGGQQKPELAHPDGQSKTKVRPGSVSQPRIWVQSWSLLQRWPCWERRSGLRNCGNPGEPNQGSWLLQPSLELLKLFPAAGAVQEAELLLLSPSEEEVLYF